MTVTLPYILAIRNDVKRAYAVAYWAWIEQGRPGDEPQRPTDLSYMAAQAVRLNLEEYA